MKKNSNEVIFRKGDKVRAIRDHFMPKKFRPYNEGDAGTVLYVPEEGRNIVVLFEHSTANLQGIYTWVDRYDFENLSL